LFLLTI